MKFAAIFACCFLLGMALLPTPLLRPAIAGFSSAMVKASAGLILHCGGKAQAEGPVLRLHAGLENEADLIADLEQGFERLKETK